MASMFKRLGISANLALALIVLGLAGSSSRTSHAQALPAFVEGKQYQLISSTKSTPLSEVPVIEMFGYFCPHCFNLEPTIEAWNAKDRPAFVKFSAVPVIWNDPSRQLARLYYTIAALHREGDLHQAAFNEIHVAHRLLMDSDNTTAERAQRAFLLAHGVSASDIDRTYHSALVDANIAKAEEVAKHFRVTSVPTFIVADRYSMDVGTAGGESELVRLVNELATREHKP